MQSKAYRGLRLPELKRHKCGHVWNSASSSARGCPHCIAARRAKGAPVAPVHTHLIERVHLAIEIDRCIADERTLERVRSGDLDLCRAILADCGAYRPDFVRAYVSRAQCHATPEIVDAARDMLADAERVAA